MAISGRTVVVGARGVSVPQFNTVYSKVGAAYVFDAVEGVFVAELTQRDVTPSSRFGEQRVAESARSVDSSSLTRLKSGHATRLLNLCVSKVFKRAHMANSCIYHNNTDI